MPFVARNGTLGISSVLRQRAMLTHMECGNELALRLVLLDDHEVARRRSVARLDQHAQLQIVGDTADGSEALRLAQEVRPDAVLIETRRLDTRGLEAIGLLSSLDEKTRPAIVAYLEILHRGDWPLARATGADDLVLREMPLETLAEELRRIVDRRRSSADGDARPGNSKSPH